MILHEPERELQPAPFKGNVKRLVAFE
jgi:hypothetical protein